MKDGKKVVITYGTYDLFHFGHENLLRRAKELGDYLIVGVTSDNFDKARGKLNVAQPFSVRMRAVEDTGIPDLVISEEYQGQKIDDIRKYGVDIFAIGSDWEGKFDHLKRYCDVVYLPRTEGVSSTELRAESSKTLRMGIVGCDYIAARMVREAAHVAGVEISGYYAPVAQVDGFFQNSGLQKFDSQNALFETSDAVYISVAPNKRASVIENALAAGKHVLCEGPMFLSLDAANEAFTLAEQCGLTLMEANKTLYFPAFERLRLLLESGVIGEIKDIRASYSHVFDSLDKNDKYQGCFYDMAHYILLPALSFLGNDFKDARLVCAYEGSFCTWTKVDLLYKCASASLSVGRGIKTEGDMVITGTNGYIYVPAPWWKLDYFEIRSEDLRDTKKHYYACVGEGQRYELMEFARLVRDGKDAYPATQSKDDILALTSLVERFDKGEVLRLEQGEYAFGGGESITDR